MSEAEKRTQTKAASGVPSKSSLLQQQQPQQQPYSFSAASRQVQCNSNAFVSAQPSVPSPSQQQQQQQQQERRKTSLQSPSSSRANYRSMSNAANGRTSIGNANRSSYGDAESYETDELEKLEVVLDFEPKMDFITTNRVVAVLERAVERLQLLSALDPTMTQLPNLLTETTNTATDINANETDYNTNCNSSSSSSNVNTLSNMDTVIKMVTSQKGNLNSLSSRSITNTTTNNTNSASHDNKSISLKQHQPITGGKSVLSSHNASNNNVNEIWNILRKRPKARGAALFHTSYGQALRPTVTAVTSALAKATNISTRGRPSVEELLRTQHELEEEYGSLLEKLQRINNGCENNSNNSNNDNNDNNINNTNDTEGDEQRNASLPLEKQTYDVNVNEENEKRVELEQHEEQQQQTEEEQELHKETYESANKENQNREIIEAKLNEVSAELRRLNKMLCVQLKDNPNDIDNWIKIRNEREELIGLLRNVIGELTRGYDESLRKPAKEITGFKNKLTETMTSYMNTTPTQSPGESLTQMPKRTSLTINNSNNNNNTNNTELLQPTSTDAKAMVGSDMNTLNAKAPSSQNKINNINEKIKAEGSNIPTSSILAGNPAVSLRRPDQVEFSSNYNNIQAHPNFVVATSPASNTKAVVSINNNNNNNNNSNANATSTVKNRKSVSPVSDGSPTTLPLNANASATINAIESANAWEGNSQAPTLKRFGSAIQMKRLIKSATTQPRIPLSSSYEEFARQILQEEVAQEWADALVRKEKELNQNVKQLQSDLTRERALRIQEVAARKNKINALHIQLRALRHTLKERELATRAANAAALEGLERKARDEDRIILEQNEHNQRLLQDEERTHVLFAQHLNECAKANDALAVEWENKNQIEIKQVEMQKIDAEQLRNQCHDKLEECERLALVERELQRERNAERQEVQERNEAIATHRDEAYKAASILQSAIKAMFVRQAYLKTKKSKKSKKKKTNA